MTPFTQRAIEIIQAIPSGKVMTYGQIARLEGNPRGARRVARLLHSMSKKHSLPWYRIVNIKGEVVLKNPMAYHEQILNLKFEGVEVDSDGRIDLLKHQWHPHE